MSSSSRPLDFRSTNAAMAERLRWLNSLQGEEARKRLLSCCGCARWCDAMEQQRPFRSLQHLIECAEQASNLLTADDWKEAFAAHPRIGGKKAAAPEQAQRWSEQEQSAAASVPLEVQRRLQQANEEYYDRFGYIFIVCATGKSAEEMLAVLEGRLRNDAVSELKTAAEEQRKITKLRLHKLVSE